MVGTTIEHQPLHACPGKKFNDLQQTTQPATTTMYKNDRVYL